MKKIIISINFICILLSVLAGLKGSVYSLILIVPYGLSLGAILAKQKKSFYTATIAANALLLAGGAILVVAIAAGSAAISGLSETLFWIAIFSLIYILAPIFNIKYAK